MSEATTDHDRLQVVVFTVGDEEYAVPVHRVESIIAGTDPTQVPGAGKHVRGVYNLRGRVISIIDLRSRLDIEPRPNGANGRVLVVTTGGHTVGLEVDEVSEVFSVDPAQLQGPPQQLTDTSIVSGILKLESRLVIIVDIDALIGAEATAGNPVAATA
jgi:purine-binding chemotaxis protein CheW